MPSMCITKINYYIAYKLIHIRALKSVFLASTSIYTKGIVFPEIIRYVGEFQIITTFRSIIRHIYQNDPHRYLYPQLEG